ncbi:MAG: 23S rRNA (uracil(1939)-C(5))-methyltransferase RlmD, partial [Lachnospiraceae bacterium]|nr:23S rRNA (uracil(1939)-C(5))-methyltransferase RlmD [Lachnospiraceae bacterium]
MGKKAKFEAPFQKNDIVSVKITDMSEDGEGIGKAQGFAVFIKDAVVGDLVRAKVMSVKKGYCYAKLQEILEESESRIRPVCPVASSCGGCQLQAMAYQAQLDFKTEKVRGHLQRIGHLEDVTVEPALGMKEAAGCQEGMETIWHYRNKAQYPVTEDKEGRIRIGFYAGRTHSIIETSKCFIGSPCNEKIVETIRAWMIRHHIRAYNEENGQGYLRHIMIRQGRYTGQIMVCLVVSSRKMKKSAQDDLIAGLTGIYPCKPEASETYIRSISLNINTSRNNNILGPEMVQLYGPDYIEDMIGNLKFRISAQSFFQVNPVQTRVLYEKALEFAGLTGHETVWDLYCGSGTITLFLARKAEKAYGVEIVPPAIENARINARENGITNAEFYVGKVEEVLPELYEKEGIRADVIVTDPPRKGCDEAVLRTMVLMQPEKIVYVSCNSATLARDLRYLEDHGYKTRKVQPVDLFPQTVHVETVCCLYYQKKEFISVSYEPKNADYLKRIPGSATYGEIKEWIQKHYNGMKVSN